MEEDLLNVDRTICFLKAYLAVLGGKEKTQKLGLRWLEQKLNSSLIL